MIMSKVEIDNKKMWESIIGFQLEGEEAKKFNDLCKYKPFKAALAFFSKAFKKGLKDQGLEYKDGKIVSILKIETGKFYVCNHSINGYESFTCGKIYKSLYDNALINDNGIEVKIDENHLQYFRPATEEEIRKLNNFPNDTCKGCYYWQGSFCNYPFRERKNSLRYGMDIGTHECTAYGNKYYKPKSATEKEKEEIPHKPKDELTEFELKLQAVMLQVKSGLIDPKDISVVKEWSDIMLIMARKQIASEIDAIQMTREMRIKDLKTLTLGAAYYQGIVNTIKKIKGESV